MKKLRPLYLLALIVGLAGLAAVFGLRSGASTHREDVAAHRPAAEPVHHLSPQPGPQPAAEPADRSSARSIPPRLNRDGVDLLCLEPPQPTDLYFDLEPVGRFVDPPSIDWQAASAWPGRLAPDRLAPGRLAPTSVPEPGAAVLLAVIVAGLIGCRRPAHRPRRRTPAHPPPPDGRGDQACDLSLTMCAGRSASSARPVQS